MTGDKSLTTVEELAFYFDRLWPLFRSISGDGVRQTLEILSEILPLELLEVPTGAAIYDWTVPKEWVVREAFVVDPSGRKILDIQENNLHLLNYSIPFKGTLSRVELDEHLHSLPDKPNAIPYVTSYYVPRWGFCLSQNLRDTLPDGDYHVVIDTDHIDGSITLGEAVLPGEDLEEVLLSTYICHPSLANNELSGPLVTAFLYRRLKALNQRRLTYRFIFLPETIGSIAYLNMRGVHLRKHLLAGYVVNCVGIAGPFTYKRSRMGDSVADRAAVHTLNHYPDIEHTILDFFPDLGSDERQYCSPGFNLPVGSLMHGMYGDYPEYHTSLDNRDLISFSEMEISVNIYHSIMMNLERNVTYRNRSPFGEPQLGRRGLWPTLGTSQSPVIRRAICWVLNYSDGDHDLLDIANLSGYGLDLISKAASDCVEFELLERVS